jgi:hypothetical protein
MDIRLITRDGAKRCHQQGSIHLPTINWRQ